MDYIQSIVKEPEDYLITFVLPKWKEHCILRISGKTDLQSRKKIPQPTNKANKTHTKTNQTTARKEKKALTTTAKLPNHRTYEVQFMIDNRRDRE